MQFVITRDNSVSVAVFPDPRSITLVRTFFITDRNDGQSYETNTQVVINLMIHCCFDEGLFTEIHHHPENLSQNISSFFPLLFKGQVASDFYYEFNNMFFFHL